MFLLYDPEIIILGIYSTKMKTYMHKMTCTEMIIVILVITAEDWEATQIPADKRMDKR